MHDHFSGAPSSAPDFLVIGHRGAAGLEPENTLRSFARALALGADMLECDVHRCAGGELVVIHDDTTDRTTGVPGTVAALRFGVLRRLDAGLGERIPALDEVLDLAGAVPVNIELKGEGTARPVIELLARRGELSSGRLISSFSREQLEECRRLSAAVRIGILTERVAPETIAFARDVGACAVHAGAAGFSREAAEAVHGAGMRVYVWAVNGAEAVAGVRRLGADGVFTDFPFESDRPGADPGQ